MKEQGSQPSARTAEQRRKNLEAVKRYYARKKAGIEYQPEDRVDGPATIGEVRPLAPGAINPMWETNDNVVMLSYHLALKPFKYKKERKFKKITQSFKTGYGVKEVEILEEDDPVVEGEKK